ncbi:MAG: hypothetical protein EZS28_005124 [Streblomastix strix]|uniref:Uncharacterized protein n=1 Tax=Streblomastix strix TaxID=222440 RepID=A0A5J4WXR2_9EUKA|nr:MAG: hypothetical protein EZS28_005124 [Streblomastix strix]
MDDATIFLIHILDKNISYKRLNQICNDINLYAMLLFRRHIWSLDGIKLHLFSETGIFQQTDYSSHNDQFPSLFGCLRFGDNIEDEWIVVTFLLHLTSHFRCLAAEIRDNDGQFLLIECADFIPIWIKPDTSQNRIFIYRGEVHIIPHPKTPSEIPLIPINPTKQQSLQILKLGYVDTHASQQAQLQIIKRIKPYLKYQENEKKIILPIQQLSLQLSLPQSLYHTSIVSLPISIAKLDQGMIHAHLLIHHVFFATSEFREETTSDEIKEQEDDDEEEEDLITDVFAFDVKQHHKDIIEVDQEDKYDINEDQLQKKDILYDNQSEQWLYINEDDVDKEIQQSGMLGVDTNKRIMNNEDKQDKQQKIDIDEDQEMVDISKKIINKTQKYIDSKSSVFGVEDPKETSNKQEKKEKIKKIESQQQESIKMGIASTLSQKEKDEVRRWLQSDDDQENGGSINNGNNKDEKQREKNKDRILNKDQIQNLLISFFDEDEGFENWMKQSVENEKGKQNNIIEGLDQLDEEQEDEVDEDEDDEDEDEDDDSQNEDEDEELEAMMQVMQGELQNNPSYSAGFETDVVSDDDYEEQEDIKLDKQKSKQNKTKNQINAEANLISGFMSSIESQGAAPGPTNVILGQLTDEALKIRRKAKKKK